MADKDTRADKADPMRKETDAKGDGTARREKDVVTAASEDSFPASDPPSYMAGSAIAGTPPSRKSAAKADEAQDDTADKDDDEADDEDEADDANEAKDTRGK